MPEPIPKSEASTQRKAAYKIVTVPDLDKTWVKLTSIIDDCSKQLSGIRKVEHVVFPLLEDSKEFLEPPEPAHIDDLKKMYTQIKWLLGQGKKEPMEVLARLEKYFPYYTLSFEQMVKEMKAEQLQKTMSSPEGVKELLRASGLNIEEPVDATKSPADILFENVDDVELSEDSYREKLKELNENYWELQAEIANTYDFGLALLDLEPVKQQLIGKIEALRT